MTDLTPEDEALLRKLEWEMLPDDVAPKHRLTTADWAAWDGYEPNDYRGYRDQLKLRKGVPRHHDRHKR